MPNRFFNISNRASGIKQEDYVRARDYVHALKSMSKIAYESIYIIDYLTMSFLYVSDNPLFLCGLTAEEVMKMGFSFYTSHVPKEEVDILLKIYSIAFQFFINKPKEERELFSLSHDFHIFNQGEKVLINHKITPLELDPNGLMWLAACCVSISNHDKPGNIEIRKIGQSSFWKYDMSIDNWTSVEGVKLSRGEKEVLLLSAQGKTVDEIAKIVNRSKDTIKFRRKSIFKKLNVKSIAEALTFASNYKLI